MFKRFSMREIRVTESEQIFCCKLYRKVLDMFETTPTEFKSLIIKITMFSIIIGLKKHLYSTNSLAKLTLLVIGQLVIGQFNKPIKIKVVVKSTNHSLGFNHHRNFVQTPKLRLSSK